MTGQNYCGLFRVPLSDVHHFRHSPRQCAFVTSGFLGCPYVSRGLLWVCCLRFNCDPKGGLLDKDHQLNGVCTEGVRGSEWPAEQPPRDRPAKRSIPIVAQRQLELAAKDVAGRMLQPIVANLEGAAVDKQRLADR